MISAVDFEFEYVHTAYELLASHIEPVAPKKWPFVNEFLEQFPEGSLLADVGMFYDLCFTESIIMYDY